MDSGQFQGADFESDVCQFVSVEHFFRKTFFKMAAKNTRISNVLLAALYKTLFASVIKSISCVLGNLPSFTYFKMQWPCD